MGFVARPSERGNCSRALAPCPNSDGRRAHHSRARPPCLGGSIVRPNVIPMLDSRQRARSRRAEPRPVREPRPHARESSGLHHCHGAATCTTLGCPHARAAARVLARAHAGDVEARPTAAQRHAQLDRSGGPVAPARAPPRRRVGAGSCSAHGIATSTKAASPSCSDVPHVASAQLPFSAEHTRNAFTSAAGSESGDDGQLPV